jgi:anti-sigma factor RsiW
MGKIIRLRDALHEETRLLLPWYATGRLEPDDAARVEAHVNGCARCRAELKLERRLKAEVADLPSGVDHGWAAMLERLQPPPARRALGWSWFTNRAGGPWRAGRPWIGWAVAAGAGAVLVVGALSPRAPTPAAAAYHTLATPPAVRPGNVVVVFRPEATEAQIRAALTAGGARLVDGPTAADAYVLNVPASQRERALASLRASGQVVAAEPVDAAGPP